MVGTVPTGVNIKNPEAHDLARELAALEHTTVTNAVIISLREAVAIRRRQASADDRLARMSAQADRSSRVDAGSLEILRGKSERFAFERGIAHAVHRGMSVAGSVIT